MVGIEFCRRKSEETRAPRRTRGVRRTRLGGPFVSLCGRSHRAAVALALGLPLRYAKQVTRTVDKLLAARHVRFTADEDAALIAAADRARQTVAGFIRLAVANEIARREAQHDAR